MDKPLLTIATLCGKEYESFLPKWKKQLPSWVNVQVYTDDSKGIFEAKNNIVQTCETQYIWMVDVDDDIDLFIKENWFTSLTSTSPDIVVLGEDGRMLWQYIFSVPFIRKCYDEVNEAKKQEGIKTLNLVSCEDMVITATKEWNIGKRLYLPTKGVNHTVNDVSKTSSTKYTVEKLSSLYRSFPELMRVSKHLDIYFMEWIVLYQCWEQYWKHYRNLCDDKEICDAFIKNVYKNIGKTDVRGGN